MIVDPFPAKVTCPHFAFFPIISFVCVLPCVVPFAINSILTIALRLIIVDIAVFCGQIHVYYNAKSATLLINVLVVGLYQNYVACK